MNIFIEIISRLIGLGLVVFIAGMSIYLTFYILPFFLLFLAIVYIIKIIKEKNTISVNKNMELAAFKMVKSVDELAEVLSSELEERTKSPLHAYRFICCEVDGASQGNNTAQEFVKYSELLPCEYRRALIEDNLMDEPNSPTEFINAVSVNEIIPRFGIEVSILIRCAIIAKFIVRNKHMINFGRTKYAKQKINDAIQVGNFRLADQWQEVLRNCKPLLDI